MKKNIALFFFSIVIAISLAEVFIRYFFPQNMSRSLAMASERGYMLNGNTGTEHHKLESISVDYHFYPPHLRDTQRNPVRQSILVLGDSFTFGWLLPWKNTFLYQLQLSLDNKLGKNSYQLLNAAMGGWGASDYLAYLEEFGPQLAPKYVIVFLNTDDIGRAMKQSIYQFSDSHSLQLTDNFHPFVYGKLRHFLQTSVTYNWMVDHLQFMHLLRDSLVKSFLMYDENGIKKPVKENIRTIDIPNSHDFSFKRGEAIRYGQAIFLRINQWCISHHAKLLVVTTGFNAFYPVDMRDPTKDFLNAAPVFFAKENIAFYDIAPLYKKAVVGKEFQIAKDHHPNALGAHLIATLTWPWLEKHIHS